MTFINNLKSKTTFIKENLLNRWENNPDFVHALLRLITSTTPLSQIKKCDSKRDGKMKKRGK